MKKVLVFALLGLCLCLFIGCENKPTSDQENGEEHRFTINGILVKDLNYPNFNFVYFTIKRDTINFDGAIVKVDDNTIPHMWDGVYFSHLSDLEPASTHTIILSCSDDSFELTKDIIMPDTFHISDIIPNRLNGGGEPRTIEWTASQYASGYFVVVSTPPAADPPAIGHNELVDFNLTSETIDPLAFNTSQGSLVEGIYAVYVISYGESFLPYLGISFDLPDGLPQGNLDGADGTIGAGVIAPKDSIIVPES